MGTERKGEREPRVGTFFFSFLFRLSIFRLARRFKLGRKCFHGNSVSLRSVLGKGDVTAPLPPHLRQWLAFSPFRSSSTAESARVCRGFVAVLVLSFPSLLFRGASRNEEKGFRGLGWGGKCQRQTWIWHWDDNSNIRFENGWNGKMWLDVSGSSQTLVRLLRKIFRSGMSFRAIVKMTRAGRDTLVWYFDAVKRSIVLLATCSATAVCSK